ncbi:MBL fold metallo-hydrolase [bacterium]|nr:MBL fold metallo-hydrolase [bacterium]
MTITYYGHSCFKITNHGGHITIVTDPFDKKIGLKPPRISADIVTISHFHHDHDNVKTIGGEPFIVDGPGEYEIKGIKIKGVDSFHDDNKGKERGLNTIYVMEVDGIKVCHLGDLGQKHLFNSQVEELSQVDVLMIPVGGVYTINGKEAIEIINQIDPKVVIPMHYLLPKLTIKLDPLDKFLREIGLSSVKPVDKLTLKKKDLKEGEARVIVMKS